MPAHRPRPLRSIPVVRAVLRLYEGRLTARGRAVFWATLAAGLVGADTTRSHAYVLFAVGAATLAVSALWASFRRPRATLACNLPSRATAGVPVEVRAQVTCGGREEPLLRLQFPRPFRWGSSIGYTPSEAMVAACGEGPSEVRAILRPARRGRYELRGPALRRTDPLGLVAGPARRCPDQALLVYPRYWTLERFEVPIGRRYQPGGIPLTSSTGDAIEFVGTRDYREGDPIRTIHWRSWARRGQPVVKEYQEEYFCRIAVVLDTFQPRHPRARDEKAFEAAISAVASVADHFSRSEFVVDILAAGPEVYEVSAGRSLAYLENILDVLSCLEPCPDAPFARIAPRLFERLAGISTVVAILQDWDDEREAFLRELRALGAGLRLIVVREGE
ncbi:MAG TPA: DUF58 domain-containing protein, partial [Vicinamibacteria bacterium]|nr:DUF58 domain-containing protein [Vicinamibacteria bacterium]